jgi:hypothetical protein
MSDKGFHFYENMLWDILDDSSKIYVLTLLIKNDFEGECKITSEIRGEESKQAIIIIRDEKGKEMELPINVLDILNN